MRVRRDGIRMNMNQLIAIVFAFLMVSSMIAWGAMTVF